MRRLAASALALALALAGCSGDRAGPDLVIERGWVRAPIPGAATTAAYFEIENTGDTVIVIDAASSPQFGSVTFHETRMQDGRMAMRPMASLRLAPGERAALAPGGVHLMLGAPRIAVEGLERVDVTLSSSGVPRITATLPVARTNPWEDAS